MTSLQFLYLSGMAIPIVYILLYVIGGLLRPGYSHISNSVSELLSPGTPNKSLLTIIQVFYALLHISFGFGVLRFVNEAISEKILGPIGAWLIIALGLTTLGTVIFPQDAEGTPQTRPGLIHKILVFGGLIPLSIFSTLFIGIWTAQVEILPGFAIYSYITVGAVVIMGVVGGMTVETRFAGLVERIAAITTQQWLLVLGYLLLQS